MMSGSPVHDAQLQQHLQQRMLSSDLHHQYQPPPPSTSSSSPWQTLNDLSELPPDDIDDGSLSLPPPPHAGVIATPFQQLVGSFGPGGSVSTGGEVDDDTVVSLDEPLHHADIHKTVHQTRSGHVLYAAQRLNAPA